jgi:hypothetical protein
MLKTLRRVLTRQEPAAKAVYVEHLERRSLLSDTGSTVSVPPISAAQNEPDTTPPLLVDEKLIGTDPRRMTGAVLTFSEPLDEASAENLEHFRIGRRTSKKQRYDFDEDDPRNDRNGNGLIRFESAVYDPATLTVTLTAVESFNITGKFRTIRVLGREELTVRDVAGNRIDGDEDGRPGKDAIKKFTFQRGSRIEFSEFDADRIALRLTGPGRLWVLRQTREGKVRHRGDAVQVFIDKADPASSVVTGKVTDNGYGDGIGLIEELINASTADVQIASDPSFQIVRSIP